MTRLGCLVRALNAQPLEEFRVQLRFEDGTQKEVDLELYLRGPVFESLRANAELFRSMRVEGGTITWDNGADIDPDVLYYDLKPAWMEEQEVVAV